MANVQFSIGHKEYELSCQPGEEKLLRRAATMLDAEAQAILEQAGRMPEARLLLSASLMLAGRMGTSAGRRARVAAAEIQPGQGRGAGDPRRRAGQPGRTGRPRRIAGRAAGGGGGGLGAAFTRSAHRSARRAARVTAPAA